MQIERIFIKNTVRIFQSLAGVQGDRMKRERKTLVWGFSCDMSNPKGIAQDWARGGAIL